MTNRLSNSEHPITRDPTFLRIWSAIFCTSLATFLLLMSLSAVTLTRTGSTFLANAVVLTQWVPAVLALPLIKSLVARHNAKRLLVIAELGTAITLLLMPHYVDQTYLLMGLLVVKGTFDNISKISRPLALKMLFDGKVLGKAASYYNTAMLVGGGIGALSGAELLNRLRFDEIVAACFVLHLISAAIYLTIRQRSSANSATSDSERIAQGSENDAWPALVYFVASVSLFQGFHNIARSVFAVHQLQMPSTGIALLQAVTNVAYVVGAFAAARVDFSQNRYRFVGPLFHGFALLTLIPLPFVTGQVLGVSTYATFAFGFEAAYCIHMRYLITAIPADRMPHVMANANAWALGLMLTLSILGSYLSDKVSFAVLTACTVLLAACVPLLAYVRKTDRNDNVILIKEPGR